MIGYTTTNGDAEIRPVLPGGPRAFSGGGALVAADRPGAAARPQALHGSDARPARDRHEHPRRAAEGTRGLRRDPEADAAAPGRVDRLRADRLRVRAEGGAVRAGPLGRAHDRPAPAGRRALPGVG